MKRKSLMLLSMFTASLALGAAVANISASANETAKKVTPTTLALEVGAAVRFGTEEDPANGLRYTVTMDKTEYTKFMAAGYTDVTFGVLIAPEFYQDTYGKFTAENVFGANGSTAIYDWAEWNEETKEWVYEGKNGENGAPVQIINLEADSLVYFKDDENSENLMKYKGAVTNLATESIVGEFRGVGYVSYTDGTTVNYKLSTGDNVRSMAYVANEAIKDYTAKLEKDTTLTEEQKKAITDKISTLNTTYIQKTPDVTYTVKHNYVRADGEVKTDVQTLTAKQGTYVEATLAESDYYKVDSENAENVLSGLAKNDMVLNVYYNQVGKALSGTQLLDVDTMTTLTVAEEVATAGNVYVKGVNVNGGISGTTLTLQNMDQLAANGLTEIKYITDTYYYTQEIDIYSLENFESESFMAEDTDFAGTSIWSNYDGAIKVSKEAEWEGKTNLTKLSSEKVDVFGAAVKPRHSTEVYKLLNNKYSTRGIYLSYQVWIEDENNDWTTRKLNDLGGGPIATFNTGRWYTINMNLSGVNFDISTDGFDPYTRLEEVDLRYDLAVSGKVISEQDYTQRYASDSLMAFYQRGFLIYFSQTKATGDYHKTNVYVTEPMIKLGEVAETNALYDTNQTVDKFVGENHAYEDVAVSKVTVDKAVVYEAGTEKIAMTEFNLANYIPSGIHTVNITVIQNNNYNSWETTRSTTIFTGTIEAYNSANGVEYAPITSEYNVSSKVNHTKYMGGTLANIISVTTAEAVTTALGETAMGTYQANGNYFLYDSAQSTTSSTKGTEHGIWVKPMHSKAYYELMQEKGYTDITYDYYIDDVNKVTGSVQYNGSAHSEAQKNAWQTASISLDNLITYFDNYNTGVHNGGHYRYTELLHLGWKSSHEAKFYLGNFGSVKAAEQA